MKKNYFKIMAIAIMVMTGVSFTSCDEQLDNPVVDPTEAETEEPVIVETATGAKITINKLSAVSSFIDELKTVIEKFQTENPGKQFVLDIETTATLEATETDYTLLIPNLSEFNIVINLNGNLVTNAKPLTLKLDQKAGTRDEVGEKIKTNYDNVITLNLKNDDIDLILDVPGTTVFINKLNSIQILNGVSVVKDGGSINTYVWAPTRNDYEMRNGEPEWVEFNESGKYIPNVRYTNGDPYCFKNLKIVKGKADYAKIYVWEENRKLDKLTIAEGAVVVLNYSPYIKEIVGEGKGATVKSSDVWWKDEEKKLVDTDLNLYNVGKITNITIEPLLTGDFKDGTLNAAYVYNAPAAIEKCVFKFGYVSFRDPEAATATVTRCEFEGTGNEKGVTIVAPYQSDKITSFKFSFYKCTFAKGTKFSSEVYGSKPKVDENGEYVYKNYYRWWDFDENGQPDWNTFWTNRSESLDDVPAAAQEVGECNGGWDTTEGKTNNGYSAGYWIEKELQYEDAEYKDYYVYLSFDGCEYDGANIKVEDIIVGYQSSLTGVLVRYEIDGKLYRALYDEENKGYILVPTDK